MMGGGSRNYIEYAKISLRNLRYRNSHFTPANIFGDPAWEIILEAYIASKEDGSVQLADLAAGLRKPISIVARLVNIMEGEGHLEQRRSLSGDIHLRLTTDSILWCEKFLERQMDGEDSCNN